MSKRQVVPSRLALKVGFRPSPKAALSRVLVLALVVAGFTVLGSGQAVASHVSCGDTITTNTTLDSNLLNCPNNGIVIGADNITLDLNGHTIDGDATPVDPCPEGETCDVGVDNSAGHSGVTMEGGSVRQFSLGVLVEGGAARNRLHQLAVSDTTDIGIFVADSTDSVIDKTSMSDPGVVGLVLVDSQQALVARNSVSGTTGYAMVLFGVDDSRIQHNRLNADKHGFILGDSARNLVQNNAVSDSGGGIEVVEGATANRVEHNRFTHTGDGMIVGDASDNLIRHNLVIGAGGGEAGGFGIILDGAVRTTVDRNSFTGGRGPAIFVTKLEAPTASRDTVISRNFVNSKFSVGILVNNGATGTLVIRNLAIRNLSDGILVENGATGTLVVRNLAIRNGDDGIDVDAPATTLTRNTANHNHDLGIEAVPGVIDGGGNHAAGNGNPAQCTNIDCK
jgi:parallel beta-helix repeat protein